MSQTLAEIITLAVIAQGTGFLLFIAFVVQKVMNGMDELQFKHFMTTLDGRAEKSVYAIAISVLPLIIAIPYYIAYGFNHWWFTAGMIVWFLASLSGKILNIPVYRWIEKPENKDPELLRHKRQQLQVANYIRGGLNIVSVVLIIVQLA